MGCKKGALIYTLWHTPPTHSERTMLAAISGKAALSPYVWHWNIAHIYYSDAVTDKILKKKYIFSWNQKENKYNDRVIIKKTTVVSTRTNCFKMENFER